MSEPHRLTESQLRRAKKLIRKLCANCDHGNCLLLDDGETCVCPQLLTYSLICRYFQEAVLPADAELCAQLRSGVSAKRKCAACGQLFSPGGNRSLYCDQCRDAMKRQRTRERVRRYRGSK